MEFVDDHWIDVHVAIRMHQLYDVDTIRIMNDKWISNSDYIDQYDD